MTVTLVTMALGQYLLLVGDVRTFVPFGVVSVILSLALVPIVMTKVQEPKPVVTPVIQPASLFRRVPLGPAGTLASGMLNGAFWGMGAVYAYRIGFSETGVAAFVSAAVLGGAFLQFPIGRFSDKHDRRGVLTVVSVLGAVLALAVFTLAYLSHAALIACAFFYGGLAFTVYGLSVAHVNDFMRTEDTLEASRALLLLHGIGAVIGPALAGYLMDALGAGSLFVYFAAVLLLLGAFGYAESRRPVPEGVAPTTFIPMGESSTEALEMDPRTKAAPASGTPD
jgi:MFS family permease